MKTMRTFLVAGLLLTGISSFAQAQTAPMKGPEIPHSEMNRKAPHNHHKLCAPNPHTRFFRREWKEFMSRYGLIVKEERYQYLKNNIVLI